MARYYYERYRVKSSTSSYYVQGSGWTLNNAGTWTDDDSSLTGYASYSFSSSSGYSPSGTQYSGKVSTMPSTFYQVDATTVYRWQVTNQGGGNYYVKIDEQEATRQTSTSYSRGTYVDTIIAEDGTYPDNGRVGTTYWYVKKGRAFPELAAKVDGQVKQGIDGWVKVGGELKRIVQMWTKAGGQLKES